jgi:hypothetical protein
VFGCLEGDIRYIDESDDSELDVQQGQEKKEDTCTKSVTT